MILLGSLGLPVATVAAGQATYLYDDLGRLHQVIDEQGNVATYTYDAVGNLLSITRNTGGVAAPTITSLSPATGNAGQTVAITIAGTGLSGASLSTDNSGITVSGVQTAATSLSASLVIAYTARTGPTVLTVQTPVGSATTTFTVNATAPVISTLQPDHGPVSRLVRINGVGFSANPTQVSVTFGGVAATVINTTATAIDTQVPAGVSGDQSLNGLPTPVVVTVNGLASSPINFGVQTAAGAAPTITSITPIRGSEQGGEKIRIRGSGFTTTPEVSLGDYHVVQTTFYGAPRTVTDSSQPLLTVTSSGGSSGGGSSGSTSISVPAPLNYKFLGIPVGNLTVIDDTTMDAIVPPGPLGPAHVLVSNANGDAILTNGFTYLAGPPERIVGITPLPGLINIPTNTPITVRFSRSVDRATITTANFGLKVTSTGAAVAGTFTFSDGDALVVFRPSSALAANTSYTVSFTQAIASADGLPLSGAYSGSFITGGSADVTSPAVSISPANGAVDVPFNTTITITFSEPIDPYTFPLSALQVVNQNETRNGTLFFSGQNSVVTFVPASPFFPTTPVTVTLSGSVTDVAGNRIVGGSGVGTDVVTSFTSATVADVFPPQVLRVNPTPAATGINANTSISATFNESLNPSTVNTNTVLLSSGSTAIAGAVVLSNFNTVVTFLPAQPLPGLSQITVTLTSGITDVAGNATVAPFTSTFTTQSAIDNFRPSVTSVNPSNGMTNVPLNAGVTIVFDERINAVTITSSTFRVNGPAGQVPGTIVVAPDQLSATFTPAQPLLPNAGHSITYTTGIQDIAGNQLFNPSTVSFTTGILPRDTTGPSVVAISPATGAQGVAVNAPMLLQFSEPVAATSVNSQTVILSVGGTPVNEELTLEQGNTVVRVKSADLVPLQASTFYELTVTTGVTDVAGNPLVSQFASSFTTGSASDTTVPTVVSRSPASGATNVARTTSVVATFSEAIDPVTVTTSTFRLTGGGVNGNVPGTLSVSADRKTVTFTPATLLFANQSYTITVSAIEDVAGNKLVSTSTSFTTAVAAGTDLTALPTAATVVANPNQLFADGVTTTTVTVSNINRSGVLVPNGTVVAVTAEPAYRLDSAGGTILGGTASSTDPRFRLFTTLGGSVTLTYQSPNRPDLINGAIASGLVQVAADAAGAPMTLIGTGTITLSSGNSATINTNPTSLLANGTSYAEVSITVTDRTGAPAPAGVAIGVTAAPVYNLSALGGTLSGGSPAADARFTRYSTIAGGLVELTYTSPALATGQSGSGVLQVVELDGAGNVLGLLGTRTISLSPTTGFTAPQPVVLAVSPANGQSGVGTNAGVMAQFSQSLDPATVTASTFSINGPTGAVAGTRTVSASLKGPNTVVTFTPTNPLVPNASFSVSITTGIRSASGNPLLASSFTTFSTGASPDTTAPSVIQVNPPDGATGVATNSVVSVEFAEPVNAVTVDTTTVTLSAGGSPVSGRLGVSSGVRGPNTIVTFTPDQLLSGNTSYQITLTTGITDPAGNPLAAAVTATFTTATGIDNFQPSVVSISPFSGQGGVPLNAKVTLRVDERINPLTLTSTTFRVNGPAGQTPGTYVVAADYLSATFTPSQPLLANSGYSITYTNGIQDIAGNKLFNPTTISFTTGSVPSDTTGPQIVTVSPADGASAVAINAPVVVQFSEPVAATSVNEQTVMVSSGGSAIPGVITLEQSNTVVRWKPANLALLAANTAHTLTVTTAVTDVSGNPVGAQVVSGFTTGGTSDATVPTVVSRSPASGATGVPLDTSLVVTFSEAIDPATATPASTFRLTGGGVNGNIPGTVSISADRKTVTFAPANRLFANQSHTITLSGIEDVAGNKLASTSTSFTTVYAPGTVLTALPTAATVVANPTQLFADGVTTTTVTVSNINRSGVMVPDGTVVAVTAEPAYRLDSAGGGILGGTVSTADPRFRLFTTLGGSLTVSYQSPNRPDLVGATASGFIQVAAADVAGAPMSLIGTGTVTLFSGSSASISTNPTSLLANGSSYAEVNITVTDRNGAPAPAGVAIGVTAAPVYSLSSLGGTITGGTVAADARFTRFSTIAGGVVELTYTAPALAAGQTGSGVIQVVELDSGGNVLGLLGTRTISLSATTGFTAPQPVVLAVSPANGQSGVGTNAVVMAQFSQSLDPATVTASTFNVCSLPGTRTLSGSRRGPNTVVTFTPTNPLAPNVSCSVSITTGIRSASGNPLLTSSFTTFSTGTSPDTTAPIVVQINPPDGATGVATNAVVSVEFAEPVNAVTVDLATVTLTSGGTLVNGRVSVGSGVRGPNTIVTFTPDQLLSGNTTYQITLTTGITDPAGNPLAAVTATFTTATGIDNFQPSVISISPFSGQSGVPLNAKVTLRVDERINPLTLTSSTFRVSGPAGQTPGTYVVTADYLSATFTPSQPLLANSGYSITYTNGIQDLAGNKLFNPTTISFSTGTVPTDATGPQVVAVSPADGTSAVAINAPVVVQFSEPVAATSVTEQTVNVSSGGILVPGTLSLEQGNTVVRWKPANLALLVANTAHTMTVTTGVTDIAGNPLVAQFVSGFTTGSASDTTVPTVVSRSPVSGATAVPRTTSIVATFSEAIDPVTVTTSTFRLTGGGVNGNIPGTSSVSADRRTVTLTPADPLFANQSYTLTLSTIEDVAGNKLTSTSTSFTTAVAAGTDLTALPTAATVVANPNQLFADGVTTTTVTVSNINRSGVLVQNGTVVAITADPAYRLDSAGGTILGGTVSAADPRFRLFTTLGGSVTLTYQAPNRPDLVGATASGLIQVASADVVGAPMSLLGTGSLTLFSGTTATISTNPTSLLANGTSVADVSIVVTDRNGAPAPAGVAIGVTAAPVYNLSALGGTLTGGTVAADSRFQRFVTIAGGLVELTYTAPALATGQSGSGILQVVELDGAGNVLGLLGTRTISLSATTGFTAPQPVVLAVSPANGQSGVGTNTVVRAQFSQSLDPATVTTSTFNVSSLAGTRMLSASGRGPNTVVTFTPTNPLAPNASFSVSITTGIKSTSGNPLLASSFTTFSTGVAADTTAPSVVQLNPPDGATGVATNAVVSVEVSEPVNAVTVDATTVTLSAGGSPVSGRLSVGSGVRGPNTIVTVTPDQLLSGNTSYQLTLTTGVTDPAGNPLATAVTATFTTATGIDNFQPSVVSISPANASVDVPADITVSVTFSEPMNPVSVNANTFFLNGPQGRVPGAIMLTNNNTVATFTPTNPLFAGRVYSVSVTSSLQDIAGNRLVNAFTSNFTTALAPGTANLPTSATVTVNPPSLFANGQIATTVIISNINRSGVQVPNGTIIAVTADPAFTLSSAGGTISGPSIGTSVDGRFLLFSTFGAEVTVSYTPLDLTSLPPGTTASGIIQVASVDLDTRPSSVIAQGTVTLFGVNSATLTATPTTLPADGASTSTLTITVKDRDGRLVPDGTRVGVTAAPIFSQTTAGGTIVGGTTSTGDSRVQLFTTAGGQITATYRAPSNRGSGTAVIQVLTVDSGGFPTGSAGTGSLTLQ